MGKLFLILIAFLSGADNCSSQEIDEKRFRPFTTIQGLSDNYVTGVVQDDYGYLWFSTLNGLNRFDGHEFRPYFQKPFQPGLLTDKLSGLRSVNNRLLLYSSKGAQWFDVEKGRFLPLIIPPKNATGRDENRIFDAVILVHQTCLLSTYTGIYVFDSSGKLIFRYDALKPDSMNATSTSRFGLAAVALNAYLALHFDRQYNMLLYDRRKNSLFSVDAYKKILPGLYSLKGRKLALRAPSAKNGLVFLDLITKEFIFYDAARDKATIQPAPGWLAPRLTWATQWLQWNDSTALLYGDFTGILTVHVNPATLQLQLSKNVAFGKQVCNAIVRDKSDRLWIATENGIFQQTLKQNALHKIPLDNLNDPQLNYTVSFTCFFPHNNSIYVGSYSKLPIAVLDRDSYQLKKQVSFQSLSPRCNEIWQIIQYAKDTLWFATQDGLIWYKEQNGHFNRVRISPQTDTLLQHKAITLLFKDSRGLIWMQSGWGGGVIRYNPATNETRRFQTADSRNYLPLRVVNFVTEDKAGNLWFAENGLMRWNRRKDQFDTLITSYYGFNQNNAKITSLGTDENGNLVFCNENNGVLLYDPVKRTYTQITTAQGLQENAVHSAVATSNGYLWVATHNFITALGKKKGQATSYTRTDGLPLALFNTLHHDPQRKRNLLAYNNEILWMNDSVATNTTNRIAFYVEAIRIADDSTLFFPSQQVRLNYNQNDFTIHCAALNYEDPESNRYAYRVNNKEWLPLGTENTIHFSNLSPGRYEVEMKFYAASESNSEITRKIVLVIRPPFWQTWWFASLVAVFLLSVAWRLYQKRIRQVKQKADLDRLLAQTEMKALHAQMNPHFIFNCLNSIREMILHNENRQASHYLSKFAQLIRLTLNNSTKPFISLKVTLDYLQRYLQMEQIRTDHFTYSLQVDEALEPEQIFIPPMVIQPFLENAIWHGQRPGRPMHLVIAFLKNNNDVRCTIDDDGIGIEAALKNKEAVHHPSIGIANIRQRIQLLNEKYKLSSTLLVQDKSALSPHETGTKVTLHFPLKNV